MRIAFEDQLRAVPRTTQERSATVTRGIFKPAAKGNRIKFRQCCRAHMHRN
jgi:hypothetical protein